MKTIDIVIKKLESEGYSGLFNPGNCACHCKAIATCGYANPSSNGYINHCTPGYLHLDPRAEIPEIAPFIVWPKQEAPTIEEWASLLPQ